MKYSGRYTAFDPSVIRTYPFSERINKVTLDDLITPETAIGRRQAADFPPEPVASVAEAVVDARRKGLPVILFTGAHLVKNGLSRLVVDLVERGMVTLVAGNGATCIHDFEIALKGATSEYVPDALGKGLFGMATEFAYINTAITYGDSLGLGLGETLGRMMCDEGFRDDMYDSFARTAKIETGRLEKPVFRHSDCSILAACYRKGIPCTSHVGIGTDVIDQHESFDGRAKGGCSGRDFLIFTAETARLTDGGVFLNVGSAVTGPEVFLKALSMSANSGAVASGIITADFDIRSYRERDTGDESTEGYYYRDQKSVVSRIPAAFAGRGHYVEGNQKTTFPALYSSIIQRIEDTKQQ